jgi:hypothetical protein
MTQYALVPPALSDQRVAFLDRRGQEPAGRRRRRLEPIQRLPRADGSADREVSDDGRLAAHPAGRGRARFAEVRRVQAAGPGGTDQFDQRHRLGIVTGLDLTGQPGALTRARHGRGRRDQRGRKGGQHGQHRDDAETPAPNSFS